MTSVDVGVVVIGRNEGRRLLDCLTSVTAQIDKTVYVDSDSVDGSVSTAERMGAFVIRLELTQAFTAARARNEGFTALMKLRPGTRFIQFIDGDCELIPGWLDAAQAFISERSDVAVVCGRRRERYPDSSLYNRLCDIEWDTPIGLTKACGGDSLIRVEAFRMIGGFSPRLIAGEEPELCVRLRERGWKIWRLDAEMTRHDANVTRLSEWWVRTVRGGHAYAEVFWLHRRSQFGIYRRQTARAIFWGGLVPLAIALSAILWPVALGAVLIYPVEICSIAVRRGATHRQSWTYALFMMLSKFAEFQGILKFVWRRWRGEAGELIEYKKAA